jgi:hypothetical protein
MAKRKLPESLMPLAYMLAFGVVVFISPFLEDYATEAGPIFRQEFKEMMIPPAMMKLPPIQTVELGR